MSAVDPRRTLDTRARIALPLCAVLLLGLATHRLFLAEPAQRPYVEFSGLTMGTSYSVKVADEGLTPDSIAAIQTEIDKRLEHVNALMSTYRDDSELSRFNAHASTAPFALSPQSAEVFRIANEVSALSGGAFDVTVRPLVAAWGFGDTEHPLEPPSTEERAALSTRIGYRKLALDLVHSTLAKSNPHVECDLSAIAKGFGVDEVVRGLVALGHTSLLVEVGGELRGQGRKLDGLAWRVGIERPDSQTRTSHEILDLEDLSLATSGDYRDYYEVNGERISHTIDPRVGAPIRHNLASVSVLHKQAVWADALATALNVLGPDAGLRLADEQGIAALFLVREGDGSFRTIASEAFLEFHANP